MEWWLIIHAPGGRVFAWPVGDEAASRDRALHNAARVAVGFPDHDDAERWAIDGYDLQVAPGEPHPSLLARATVGTVDELRAVAAPDVDAHDAARVAYTRGRAREAARAVLAELTPEDRAAVLADPGPVRDER